MVVGVVPLVDDAVGTATGHDAPQPAVVHTRGVHGVFTVVAEWLFGEGALVIAKARVVLRVRVGSAGFDEVDGVPGLCGEVRAGGGVSRRGALVIVGQERVDQERRGDNDGADGGVLRFSAHAESLWHRLRRTVRNCLAEVVVEAVYLL